MQSASTVLRPDSHCPNPSILIDFRRSPKLKPLSLPQRGKPYRKLCSLTNNRSTQQSSLSQSNRVGSRSSPHRPQLLLNVGRILLFRWTYRVRLPKPGRGGANIDEFELGVHTELFTHMWWPELRSSFGKRINFEGIVSAARVLLRDQHLALPHMAAPDIRYIDWVGLRKHGFKDVVFDKDNMITLPYSLALWAPLGSSMEECKSVFRKDIAVFSNSAGHLKGTLESKSLGIVWPPLIVSQHLFNSTSFCKPAVLICASMLSNIGVKKPAGTAEEIKKHFGCTSSQFITVGDRPFTYIVYGNHNDYLTVLTKPLSTVEEPFIVRQVRKLEMAILNYWLRRGLEPTGHHLLPDPMECVKDDPLVSKVNISIAYNSFYIDPCLSKFYC